ncbi:WXG100 family type VII secretion target [Streptomyces sp. HB2AG]|uniref:WXG100 family type VII secretion target n=1 Tax=Streptomyces sp. HB2AG TaxID=2983400 RepID=UPI0022AB3262|nr:WXG100 family type VII secretion target [Streptomyces sp. HB2AG]MCZ2528027.1 WXG100 family type VII secretion target [Streptomyces sp. HB2AG]
MAEEIFEAGVELVNPGGRPDVLRGAAKGWSDMGNHLESTFRKLDQQVQEVLGESWRGPAADAFKAHWAELKKDVGETLPVFDSAAKELRKAADSIEEINEEIHQIYLEIGISIGISVGLSFITMGFSAAAGAANAVRLAGQAVKAAGRLGKILSAVAKAFRSVRAFTKGEKWFHKTAKWGLKLGGNYAVGVGSGTATSILSGKGPEVADNLNNAAWGIAGGAFAGKVLGGRLGGGAGEASAIGALGGAVGGVGGDATNALRKGEDYDLSQVFFGAAAGAGGGAAGGAAAHRFVNGTEFTGDRALAAELGINAGIGVTTGEQGNDVKDADAKIFGDPNADKAEEKPGLLNDARKEQLQGAEKVRERPDVKKFGAFG